jgi:uncharacterized protein YbjT (DUF2867 family)
MNDKKTQATLVLGGTGKTGRRVAQRLATPGAAQTVGALTQDGHAGHVYEVTGPRLLTFAEAISERAGVWGIPAVSGASR